MYSNPGAVRAFDSEECCHFKGSRNCKPCGKKVKKAFPEFREKDRQWFYDDFYIFV